MVNHITLGEKKEHGSIGKQNVVSVMREQVSEDCLYVSVASADSQEANGKEVIDAIPSVSLMEESASQHVQAGQEGLLIRLV